jgi:hypothetical protein
MIEFGANAPSAPGSIICAGTPKQCGPRIELGGEMVSSVDVNVCVAMRCAHGPKKEKRDANQRARFFDPRAIA